jgi:hypothetical protein
MLFAGTATESYPEAGGAAAGEGGLKYSSEAPSRHRDIWTV